MIKKFLKKIKKHPAFIFFILDIFLIVLASYLAFLLKFDAQIPTTRLTNFFAFIILALAITPIVFYFFNLYRISWSYVSLTDLPTIGRGVVASVLLIGTVLYFFRNHPYVYKYFLGFPRSVIFIYGILLLFLISLLRFSKRIYWQLIRSKTGVLRVKDYEFPLTSKVLNENQIKNILVTGGAGYIGSVLVRKLIKAGYKVKVIDKLLFGAKPVRKLKSSPNFTLVQGDILDTDLLKKMLVDVDAVVHLAAIVGEPACLSKKDIALKTNYLGTIYLARLCKAYGIKKFIYTSTCSTYGQQEEKDFLKEKSQLRPVDFYGETKIYAEREIMKLMDKDFAPTILRFSTIYGLSPRMRFDLVVNALTKKAVKDKEIFIFGGDQWRPLAHVDDIARAIFLVLRSPLSKVGNQVFNVGGNKENYLISQVGDLVKECIPGIKVETVDKIDDKRSYQVDFSKIEKTLGFKTKKTVKDGIIEINNAIKEGRFDDLEDKIYYNHLV